jgi:DNA polymerase Ligase (LigD)
MAVPSSLGRAISPPPTAKKRTHDVIDKSLDKQNDNPPTPAAIEAGKARIRNHLDHFCFHLGALVRHSDLPENRLLPISDFAALYQRNQHVNGHHFVIHQHNHPVAGVHYDLRLQFSETSTVSFAIPYGLPGNPNSRRQGRLAIETRVHNLWNNLIESASHATGSLLIWDTGEYEVLPRKMKKASPETDDERSNGPEDEGLQQAATPENEKFIYAFRTKYIRLRLRGHRLPDQYTITLRLPSTNNSQYNHPKSPPRKRRKKVVSATLTSSTASTDSEDAISIERATGEQEDISAIADASDDEAEMSNIRATNAYPGAVNSIGSVHQRHWFVSHDKANSGLVKAKSGVEEGQWISQPGKSFQPFFVRGAEVEKSVITGRTSDEVMSDEGIEGFVARKRWKPILD